MGINAKYLIFLSEKCPSLWKIALSRVSSRLDVNNEKYIKMIMGCNFNYFIIKD